jgi:hypothetical protein
VSQQFHISFYPSPILFSLTIDALAKMPPAARGSFEKPPLDPVKLFII